MVPLTLPRFTAIVLILAEAATVAALGPFFARPRSWEVTEWKTIVCRHNGQHMQWHNRAQKEGEEIGSSVQKRSEQRTQRYGEEGQQSSKSSTFES